MGGDGCHRNDRTWRKAAANLVQGIMKIPVGNRQVLYRKSQIAVVHWRGCADAHDSAGQYEPKASFVMPLLIRSGQIVTASDSFVADIYCEDETITRIGPGLEVAAIGHGHRCIRQTRLSRIHRSARSHLSPVHGNVRQGELRDGIQGRTLRRDHDADRNDLPLALRRTARSF